MEDYLSPELVADGRAARKVEHSIISLDRLVEGHVRPDEIERAFSPEGCGAVLVKLDSYWGVLYERFYRLQWELSTRAFEDIPKSKETASARFAALDLPLRQLLHRCGVCIARTRSGLANPVRRPKLSVESVHLRDPLSAALGRPLAANRHEFHPSVDWLIEQEKKGCLRTDESPSYAIVADFSERGGKKILGRVQADEARLLALYREWKSSSFEERVGHGNKYNGDIYYGAFRGRTHIDSGGTMTVLFGPGDLRGRDGSVVTETIKSAELGGTLMVASPGEDKFVSLPYRLRCGSPYVVVFFETYIEPSLPPPATSIAKKLTTSGGSKSNAADVRQLGRPAGINPSDLGWAPTVHGVRRIEHETFSRGQVVVHVVMTSNDLV